MLQRSSGFKGYYNEQKSVEPFIILELGNMVADFIQNTSDRGMIFGATAMEKESLEFTQKGERKQTTEQIEVKAILLMNEVWYKLTETLTTLTTG